jgi:hypothetical protein
MKNINYLNVNRFYISFNMKKIIFYLKRMSANFYFEEITKCKMYFYTSILNFNKMDSGIFKIYNSIISNKYYDLYNLNVINQYSDILVKCSLHFNDLLRNYKNINKNV